MTKTFRLILIAAITAFSISITVYGAEWYQDPNGWQWIMDDNSKLRNTWMWLDNNQDGIYECYYIDSRGYLLTDDITPDGYTVDAFGAWTVDGVVQTRTHWPFSEEEMDKSQTYAHKIFNLVNEQRIAEGKLPLKWDNALAECAAIRTEELTQTFSHARPDGRSCFSIYQDWGLSYSHAGENFYRDLKPEDALNGWMHSQTHKENILYEGFTYTGVSCCYYNNQYYWVQLFAAPFPD